MPTRLPSSDGGRALSSFNAFERERMGLEGTFLSPAHPRVAEHVARVAQAHGKPSSVCGEMAGDYATAVLLMGFGYTSVSVAPMV